MNNQEWNNQEWLDSLKIDDCVVMCYGGKPRGIYKIKNVTKTQIHIDNIKFRRSDGSQIINSYHSYYIKPVTEEDREIIFRNRCVSKISKVKWDNISLEAIQEIVRIIDKDSQIVT